MVQSRYPRRKSYVAFFFLLVCLTFWSFSSYSNPIRGEVLSRLFYKIFSNANSQGKFMARRLGVRFESLAAREAGATTRIMARRIAPKQEILWDLNQFLLREVPEDMAANQGAVEARLGTALTKQEFEHLVLLRRMGSAERTRLLDDAVQSVLPVWRQALRDSGEAPLWSASRLANSGLSAEGYSHVNWMAESGEVFFVRNADEISFRLVYKAHRYILNETPTHVRLRDVVDDLVALRRVKSVDGVVFVSDDIVLVANETRFVNVVLVSEGRAYSSVFVDLVSGNVFGNSAGAWENVMGEPMIKLFREHMVEYGSSLSALLNGGVERICSSTESLRDVSADMLLETGLAYQGHGRFRYSLRPYDFKVATFRHGQQQRISLIVDFSNHLHPLIIRAEVDGVVVPGIATSTGSKVGTNLRGVAGAEAKTGLNTGGIAPESDFPFNVGGHQPTVY